MGAVDETDRHFEEEKDVAHVGSLVDHLLIS